MESCLSSLGSSQANTREPLPPRGCRAGAKTAAARHEDGHRRERTVAVRQGGEVVGRLAVIAEAHPGGTTAAVATAALRGVAEVGAAEVAIEVVATPTASLPRSTGRTVSEMKLLDLSELRSEPAGPE
eukprot:s888_g3.t1